jgi:hypothetical protein
LRIGLLAVFLTRKKNPEIEKKKHLNYSCVGKLTSVLDFVVDVKVGYGVTMGFVVWYFALNK